jgi:signal transduction histidine kinase
MTDVLPAGARRVAATIAPDAAFVVSDRGRLSDILTNLLDNALKISPDDQGVELVATCTERDGTRIEVRDHGVGIPLGDRASIFDRFHQRDRSATRRVRGLGLGLHLVRSMVEELGGRAEVDAREGGGSVFVVTLPPPDGSFLPARATAGSRSGTTG